MKKVNTLVKNHKTLYTKEHIATVIDLWETKTKSEIAAAAGIEEKNIGYLANQIRLAGHKLPKKHFVGRTQNLVKEVLRQKGLIR